MKRKTYIIYLLQLILILISILFFILYLKSKILQKKQKPNQISVPFQKQDQGQMIDISEIYNISEPNQESNSDNEITDISSNTPNRESKPETQYISEKEITAYHEAGHTLIAIIVGYLENIRSVTIQGSTQTAGKVTRIINSSTEDDIIKDILISGGGQAAEMLLAEKQKMNPESVGKGCGDDMESIKYNVRNLSFSKRQGLMRFNEINEINKINEINYYLIINKSKEMLKKNQEILDKIQAQLFQKNTLNQNELTQIINETQLNKDYQLSF